MFRHILVPIDDHPACDQAAHHAFALNRALGGQITLLYVLEQETPLGWEAAQHRLRTLSSQARRPPACAVVSVREHKVLEDICTYAALHRVGLIVLGIRGDGGLEDEAMGKFAANLARLSAVPVHLTGGEHKPLQSIPASWQTLMELRSPERAALEHREAALQHREEEAQLNR